MKTSIKKSILIKTLVVLPIILFVDYILMVVIGCTSCLFGFGENFYCSSYCLFGKIILGVSFIFFFFIVLPDIKMILKNKINATSTEKS